MSVFRIRGRTPLCALAVLLFLTPAGRAGAQTAVEQQARSSATAAALPAFRLLRFDEDWSRAAVASGDWLDRLKAIPLDSGGSVMLRVGGQLRARAEGVSNYQLGSGADRSDAFEVVRQSLWGDLHVGTTLRAFVELRNSQALSRDLPGGARTSDFDATDVENAFVEIGSADSGRRSLIRLGRQEISLGRERVIGVSDWSNTRTMYQGLDARWAFARATIGALVVRPVTVRSRAPDLADSLTLFRGVYVNGVRTGALSAWELYALKLDDRATLRAGRPGDRHEVTAGARLVLSAEQSPWSLEGEGALQRGRLTDTPVRAWFVASELTYAARDWRWSPQLSAGFDWASGGGDSARLATYAPPATTGHAHAGLMDIIGRANLVEARTGLAFRPRRALTVQARQHWFWRASTGESAFAKSMAVLGVAGGSPARALGGETDLTASLRLTRRLRVDAGVGYFAPGEFLLAAATPARPSTWTFLSTAYTF